MAMGPARAVGAPAAALPTEKHVSVGDTADDLNLPSVLPHASTNTLNDVVIMSRAGRVQGLKKRTEYLVLVRVRSL